MQADGKIRLAVLGAGSVRCMPSIVGAIANFFGERPLEVRLWDADPERLDLFDRLLRLVCAMNKCRHTILAGDEPDETLDQADRIILAVGFNCAGRYLGERQPEESGAQYSSIRATAARRLLEHCPPDAALLNLIRGFDAGDLGVLCQSPEPIQPPTERVHVPHQVLRYLFEDEWAWDYLRFHARSPIRTWIEDPLLPVSAIPPGFGA